MAMCALSLGVMVCAHLCPLTNPLWPLAVRQACVDGRVVVRVFLATTEGNPMRVRMGPNDSNSGTANALLCIEVGTH